MISDSEIVSLLMRNSKQGFKSLFKRYYKPLVLFADTFINDINKSEDIVQEFLSNFWEKKQYKNINNTNVLSSYLFTSIKNKSLSSISKKDILNNSLDLVNIEISEAEAKVFNDNLFNKINAIISLLPDQTKEIFICIFYHKMKKKEVANELGISINTVKTLFQRALNQLREEYKDDFDSFILFFSYLNPSITF